MSISVIVSKIPTLQTIPCRFPNTLDEINTNNGSDTMKRLQNPIYDEMSAVVEGEGPGPTYEIIPMISNSSNRRSKPNGVTSTKLIGQLCIANCTIILIFTFI